LLVGYFISFHCWLAISFHFIAGWLLHFIAYFIAGWLFHYWLAISLLVSLLGPISYISMSCDNIPTVM